MTLPWFLNPWAEVRRLRVRLQRSDDAQDQAWIAAKSLSDALDMSFTENADLRRQIEVMSKWIPHDPRPAGPGVIRMQEAHQVGEKA